MGYHQPTVDPLSRYFPTEAISTIRETLLPAGALHLDVQNGCRRKKDGPTFRTGGIRPRSVDSVNGLSPVIHGISLSAGELRSSPSTRS